LRILINNKKINLKNLRLRWPSERSTIKLASCKKWKKKVRVMTLLSSKKEIFVKCQAILKENHSKLNLPKKVLIFIFEHLRST